MQPFDPQRSIQNQARPRRIVIATWGSLGDLHPYLSIACELRRRGHQVLVATNTPYRSKVQSLDLEFRALGPEVPEGPAARAIIERAMHPWRGSQWLFESFLDPYARRGFDELDAACEGADFLLAHAIVLAAPLVAHRRGLKWTAGVLSPISLWSRHDAPTAPLPFNGRTPNASRVGALWGQISKPLARELTRSWFRHFDALRVEMGLSTRPHPLFDLMFADGALALFSRQLGRPQADWPRPTVQCGAPALQQAQVLEEPEWHGWIEAGASPIVWTLGSTAVHIARDFWRHAFHAGREMHLSRGLRSLFLAGGGSYWRLPTPPREWGLVAGYAPFEALFPLARIIVHQGGVGTTQAAMKSGAPQLIVPWAQDQPDNAARIVARGLGLSLHRARFDAGSAIQVLSALADNPKYLPRARDIARLMQQQEPHPAARAADAVEARLSQL